MTVIAVLILIAATQAKSLVSIYKEKPLNLLRAFAPVESQEVTSAQYYR